MLLAVHQDGEIRCLSEDLQLEEWKTKIVPASNLRVEHALVLSLEEATQSVLKNHEDVLGFVGRDKVMSQSHVLFLVTRVSGVAASSEEGSLYLHLFLIGVTESAYWPLQELISLNLPEPNHAKSGKFNYSWHGSSGTLLQNTSSAVAVYDLVSLVPQLTYHMRFSSSKISSCLRLSSFLIAVNTSESISIIDMKFGSLQAEQPVESTSKCLNQAVGQKHSSKENGATNLLSYFASLNLVIVLRERKLLALQLSSKMEQAGWSRKRKRGGLLVDSIGRGAGSIKKTLPRNYPLRVTQRPLGTALSGSRTIDSWSSTRDKLDSLFITKNFKEFESLMASELRTTNEPGQTESETDLRKIHYLLSKVFTMEQSQRLEKEIGTQSSIKGKLKISWFSDILCSWMIRHGLFSVNHIEASLKSHSCFRASDSLIVGAYTQALIEWDKSFKTLQLVFTNPVRLDAREIVHALRHLMGLLNTSEPIHEVELPENGNLREKGRPDQKMDFASPHSRNNHENTAVALESIFLRLHSFPKSAVTQALKSELSTQDLRSLVDLLRIALARGRWLSPYVDDSLESIRDNGLDCQISIIAKLLNCVIDGIGAGGWILGASVTDDISETADTIACMKAEISAALEGIEEASYIRSMLTEILLYGKSSYTSQSKHHGVLGTSRRPLEIQSMSMDSARVEDSALPLGLKAAQGVSTMKVGAGGELIERSQRDISRLKSRMVGKYSFDQITI